MFPLAIFETRATICGSARRFGNIVDAGIHDCDNAFMQTPINIDPDYLTAA